MSFDFKKEYKELYLPPKEPQIIDVPPMNYLAVRGHGDPNSENSDYKRSIELLYPIIFTIKMSPKSGHAIDDFFNFVVPPLEGFWWQDHSAGDLDYSRKSDFQFFSVIRLPDFIQHSDFDWAIAEATQKKQRDFSAVEFLHYEEGTCVQCMHLGPYDDEPATIAKMHDYLTTHGYALDIQNPRYHHEIYLSDPRRCAPDKLRTVLRHPVREV